MKILRVIASMNPKSGGPCQGIRNSVPELKRLEVENDVVCFDPVNTIYKDNFRIVCLGKGKTQYQYQPKLNTWLKKNIHDYNIIIIHGLWLYNSYGTFLTWKKTSNASALFIMPHGMLDPYFQKAPERKLKAYRNEIIWRLFEKKVVNNATGMLFTCEQEMILAQQTFNNYHPKKELNIGYGIEEPPAYNEVKDSGLYQLIDKKPFWLFLSRIHPKKGVDMLIRAYQKLETELGELPNLVIAGPGIDSEFGKEIKMMATSPKIFFPGMLLGNLKWEAFYDADLFVLPSHQENFGIAVAEALACGTPVLITDKVNIFKEIKEASAGLVAHDNEISLYKELKNWHILDFKDQECFKINAKKCFRYQFTVQSHAENMKKKLNEIL